MAMTLLCFLVAETATKPRLRALRSDFVWMEALQRDARQAGGGLRRKY